MSQDQAYWSSDQPPPPRPASGGGTKLLLGIAIGCGVVMLLGCAGLFVAVYFAQQWFKESMSQDPAVVRQATAQMAEIEVPQGLAPSASFTPSLPFGKAQSPLPNFVIYADQASNSMLMLTSIGNRAHPQARAQMQQQMDDAFRQRGNASSQDFQSEESHVKEIKIGDQTAKFVVSKGRSANSKQNRIVVQGTFDGNSGLLVMLMFMGDADKYDEPTLVKMLESIKVK